MSVIDDQIDDLLTYGDEYDGCHDMLKYCPACGKLMKTKNGKYGKFRGCSGFPDCDYTESFQEYGKTVS